MLKPILLVEDDEADIELAMVAFERTRLANDVVIARDGPAALEMLRSNIERAEGEVGNPAVVFLDKSLPKLTGLEVLAAMKADPRLQTIPVVLLTASDSVQAVEEAYSSGANAFVCKPVGAEAFIDAIARLGLFWAVINEPPAGTITPTPRQPSES